MTLDDLKKYSCWVGKSAQTVYLGALSVGGWKNVFPTSLPRWASRVRNYFNVNPMCLERLPDDTAKRALKHVQKFAVLLECHEVQSANRTFQNYRPNPNGKLDPPPFRVPAACPVKADYDVVHTSTIDSVGTKNALTSQVYRDESKRMWYLMSAGSTIYHFGKHPRWALLEAIWQDAIRGQNDTPVFKLINPDNTGGSNEVVLGNDGFDANGWGKGGTEVGKVGERWNISKLILTDPRFQGSYNYSETVEVGLAAHEMRDVKTHEDGMDFYVNPADRFSSLASRIFPPTDPKGKSLADQG